MVAERDDPMPERRKGRDPTPATKMARSLRVGGCMLCETITELRTAKSAMRKAGFKSVERKVKGGWLLWRAE